MLFDVQTALAEILQEAPATSATSATLPANVAIVASVAGGKTRADPPSRQDEVFPYGFALGDRPKTWTRKVVSLEEWRRLSNWDRHGSTGKHWNGLTRAWEPDGAA